MGKISSPHVELLMESMKWNAPNVDFKIINVLNSNDADSNGYDHINQLARKHEVWNFHFTSITQDNLSKVRCINYYLYVLILFFKSQIHNYFNLFIS